MAEGRKGTTKFDRQDTEDVTDLPLYVPVSLAESICLLIPIKAHHLQVSVLYEHFQCIICMSRIKESCITSCGHRFCSECIEECIDRRYVHVRTKKLQKKLFNFCGDGWLYDYYILTQLISA